MRIAVCDDEQIFLDQICRAVQDFYCSLDLLCIPFSDGEEVIAAYHAFVRTADGELRLRCQQRDGLWEFTAEAMLQN